MNPTNEFSRVPIFILAGGLGTRLSEETGLRPKPMVEIGGTPILVHIMRWYYAFGFNDFVVCGGYKSWEIKDYFLNYQYRQNDFQIDHRTDVHQAPRYTQSSCGHEEWRVSVMDTGVDTLTGGRLAMALERHGRENDFEDFGVTYGDGLTNADLAKEFAFHREHARTGTMLGVAPLSRFGEIERDDAGVVKAFIEKPEDAVGLINGGYFFFKKKFRDYVAPVKDLPLERAPLEKLCRDAQLVTYEHRGFWQCMDTLRDKQHLQAMWESGQAPWLRSRS